MRLWTVMLGAWLATGSGREAEAAAVVDRVGGPVDPAAAGRGAGSADRRPEPPRPASGEA